MLLAGHPNDSISERSGRALKYYRKQVKIVSVGSNGIKKTYRWQYYWFKVQCFIIDVLLYLPDGCRWNHCIRSIGDEAHAKELWNWGG